MIRKGPEILSRGNWSACENGLILHSNLDFWFLPEI